MPIFFQKDLSDSTKIGIWKIEEDEQFFLAKVVPQRNVTHGHKKLQHLAGRYLLRYLFPAFPTELIKIADTRKPFLDDEAYHFSISHCGNYAAAIVSTTQRVGVDIEVPRNTVQKIKNKFLSLHEIELLTKHCNNKNNGEKKDAHLLETLTEEKLIYYLTQLWSCKEAVFKWYGLGEVDFKKHIVMQKQKQISALEINTEICFQKDQQTMLHLCSEFFINEQEKEEQQVQLVLSYVATPI